jgi:hypothetical protein
MRSQSGGPWPLGQPGVGGRSLRAPSQALGARGCAARWRGNHAGRSVLIVDDEEDARDLLRIVVESCDARAHVAAGTVVALRERNRASLSSYGCWPIGVALLAASLGCVRLGFASVASVAVGMLVGRARCASHWRRGQQRDGAGRAAIRRGSVVPDYPIVNDCNGRSSWAR